MMSGRILVTSVLNFANSPGEIRIDSVDVSRIALLIVDFLSRMVVELS